MTAASVALWTLMAGPSRPAKVLQIEAGTVYLRVDPVAGADSRDGRDHPGAIVALLAAEAVRLPIGIVLPPAAADLVPVSVAGSSVSRGEITIGWGAISVAETRWPVLTWWNPGVPALPLPPPSITPSRLENQSETGDSELPGRPGASSESGASADSAGPPDADSARSSDATDALADGLAALVAGDPVAAVERLIGVGGGPIPVGDDVLAGALVALAAWAPDSRARSELAAATATAAERTTPIAAALLQSAATGFATPDVVDHLSALSTPGADPDQALARLVTIGIGSGAAIAAGIRAQLQALHGGRTRTSA